MVDERLKAFAGKHLQSAACHPNVLLRVAVSNRHQDGGLFALHQLDGGVAVHRGLCKVHAKEGDAGLLLVGVVQVAKGFGVVDHVAVLVSHYLSVVVALRCAALQCGVYPVEVPTGLLVAMAIRAVLHHLSRADVAALVQLPKYGVAVSTVAHVVVHQYLGDTFTLNYIPLDVLLNPSYKIVRIRIEFVLCAQHHLGRQVQRGQWWRCGFGHVLPIHGHIVHWDAVELTQPAQGIGVG